MKLLRLLLCLALFATPSSAQTPTRALTIDRETGRVMDRPEGPWFKVGDFVRLPKYGGDRFDVEWAYEDYEVDSSTGRREKLTRKDKVVFAIFKVKDVIAKITASPLSVKAFWD